VGAGPRAGAAAGAHAGALALHGAGDHRPLTCESGLPGVREAASRGADRSGYLFRLRGSPWQRLNFLPEPHGHGSLRFTPAYSSSLSSLCSSTPPSPSTVGAEYSSFFGRDGFSKPFALMAGASSASSTSTATAPSPSSSSAAAAGADLA